MPEYKVRVEGKLYTICASDLYEAKEKVEKEYGKKYRKKVRFLRKNETESCY